MSMRFSKSLALGLAIAGIPLFGRSQTVTPEPLPAAFNSGVKINYVRTFVPLMPISDPAQVVTAPVSAVLQTTNYIDGQARMVEAVSKAASPGGKDLVSYKQFDAYGRETIQYLPYVSTDADGSFKTNPFLDQQTFYTTPLLNGNPYPGEQFFYGKTELEKSPIDRQSIALPAGNSWVGSNRGTQFQYGFNSVADGVRLWTIGDAPGSVAQSANGYNPAQLYKNTTTDEAGHSVVEYKTKDGRVVLKKVQEADVPGADHIGWLCTYYVYDDFGMLRCVIQPKAVATMQNSGNWQLTSPILNELCFRYEYDHRNRMIVKKVPGAGEVWMVYDKRDRVIMTQDANLRASGKWLLNFYDALDRPITTGLYTHGGDRNFHQTEADSHFPASYPFPAFDPSGPFERLTLTAYDTYDGMSSGLPSGTLQTADIHTADFFTTYNTAPEYAQPVLQSMQTVGLPTWSGVKVLGSNDTWLYTVNIYDEKGRLIQVKSQNVSGGVDIVTSQYSFSGKALLTNMRHQKGAGNDAKKYTIITKNTYNYLGRISQIEKKLIYPVPPVPGGMMLEGSSSETETDFHIIAQYSYDALGQLKTKKLAPSFNGTGLETLTYDYNIRGWLLGANRSYAKNSAVGSNWFGFDLGYDKQDIKAGSTSIGSYAQPAYNGNITGTVWKSRGDGEIRKYDFGYDPVNRLTGAAFTQLGSGGFGQDPQLDFSISNLTYDANGNIFSMDQKGWKLGGSTFIDKLRYFYQPGSNKLQNVMDLSNSPTTRLGDFRYSSLHPKMSDKDAYAALQTSVDPYTVTDYFYDENGNLVKDYNKDITGTGTANGIEYNHLNLPTKIIVKKDNSGGVKGSIEYVYDAAGNKLKKVVHETNKDDKETLYLFGTYEKNGAGGEYVLQFFPHEEGRIRMAPVSQIGGFGHGCDPVLEGFDADGFPIYSECLPPPTVEAEAFEFDYFLKDHLGNVRAVLTEQQKESQYPGATLELADGQTSNTTEESLYANLPETRTSLLNVTGYPQNEIYHENKYAAKVNGATVGHKIGPGIMLKVMSGDYFHLRVQSWYKLQPNQTPDPSSNPVSQLITAIAGGAASVTGLHGTAATIETSGVLGSATSGPVAAFFGDQQANHTVSGRPKAYLNWILLDERFNFVAASSGAEQVPAESDYNNGAYPNNNLHQHIKLNLPVTKNGYLYVFVSNETPNLDVFFDNLQVTHIHGPLLEETQYYPFGLTMAGISSKAAGGTENKKKYQQYELNTDFDINLYETFYRSHDPQLGRFWQIDPKPVYESEGVYNAMNNNPISNVDILGDITHYYGTDGTLLRSQEDGRKHATITVISEENIGLFAVASALIDLVNAGAKKVSGKNLISDKTVANLLSTTGISYDTKEYADYYEKYSKDYYKGNIWVPTDGKGPLVNENMDGLKLVNGSMRVVDNNPTPDKGNSPELSSSNEGGERDIHTHTLEGRRFTRDGRAAHVDKGAAAFGGVFGNDLSRDSYETPGQERYRTGIFNVVVTPTHVYLYRHGQLTIAVDRNGVPSKNPGEIK